MKKLAIAMSLALTASMMLSTAASAAMLKPKDAAKSAPKSSASEKSGDKAAAAASVNTVTIARTKATLGSGVGGSSGYIGVPDKNGTESITLENVVATKKEKITVFGIASAGEKPTTYKLDATIYEVPAGSKVFTTSSPAKGIDAAMEFYIYKPDAKGTTYQTSFASGFDIGEVAFGDGDIGYMFQPQIIWTKGIIGQFPCTLDTYEHKTPVFIRVVAAE